MMTWLDSVFGSTDQAAQGATVQINAAQVNAFRQLLQLQPRIRLYVGTGGSYGNQAATVNLLRRLVDPTTADNLTYAYAGIIDVHYDPGAGTLAKLYELLPELLNQPNGHIRGATVNLIQYDALNPPAAQILFAFTSAVDESNTNFAVRLNTDYFLQLQPYNYNYPEKVWFLDGRVVDLRAVKELNDPSFARRVSYLPPTTYTPPNWGAYGGNPAAPILQYLTGDPVLNSVRLVVSYAIMPAAQNVINSSPEAAATMLCGGLLAWQQGGNYQRAQPVVVVNLNRFGAANDQGPLTRVRQLLDGGMTPNEVVRLTSSAPQNIANAQQIRQVFETRRAYMLTLKASTRFSCLNYPTVLANVQNAVQAITGHNDQVLFIQLGPIPQPLYYYALSRTNMFSLFEGANSTMAGVNIGRPFLALPRRGAGPTPALYPNVNRGLFSSSPPIDALAATADQLNFELDSWPTGMMSTAPCDAFGAFVRKLTDETKPTDPIRGYFSEISALYSSSAADKINVAMAYLMHLYQVDHPQQQVQQQIVAAGNGERAAVVVLAADANPLDELYLELKQKVTIGKRLDLVPGIVAGGNIENVILTVLRGLSATLWLDVDSFEHDGQEGSITEIRLTGTTGVLGDLGVTNAITVVFDAPDKQLRTGLELGSAGVWSIPGVPWIQLSEPFLRIMVSDSQVPVTASIGGTFDPVAADLEVLLPVVANQWLTTASFHKPYPSADRAFQLAAGVNLVRVLPPPLNAVVDFGLAQVDLYYDYSKQDVPSLGFILRSNSDDPLPLVGRVSLRDLEAQVAVVNPKTKLEARVSASGSFVIGTGADPGVVVVTVSYPNFVFSGKLSSGTVQLTDVFSLFLPDVVLDLLTLPAIEAFDFNYTSATDNLAVSMTLGFSPAWRFEFLGKALFELENVGFAISRSKGANTGAITATTTLLPDMAEPLVVAIGALYQGNGVWRFSIQQQVGTTFSINELLRQYLGSGWESVLSFPDVTGLRLQLDWGSRQATSYEFEAATATPWTPIPVLPDLTVTGKLKVGYRASAADEGANPPGTLLLAGRLMLPGEAAEPAPGSYGQISADITLWNIKLGLTYDFDPQVRKLTLRWGPLTATIAKDDKSETTATFTLDNISIGSLVEMFVSWATGAEYGLAAPWNVLDEITLNGLKLIYNFTTKKVSFGVDIGPIELGLFTIKGVTLGYDPTNADQPVMITVIGSFAWQSGDKLSWDPTKPETTPAPPGGGNKYLDLRLAALGQHVTVPGLTQQKTVQDVIRMLRDLKVPNPPEIPVGGVGQPVFEPASSWFIAFDFGVLKAEEAPGQIASGPALSETTQSDPGTIVPWVEPTKPPVYLLQLSIVFNDPTIYALRVALDGPMAKIFAGLDFQILYRQVSESVGVYSARIALPNLMRKFQVGIATITLPDFAVDVYTNGDFQIDIGFPWNSDFSRSFTIEVIVPPGIPFLGSAGFYFGKLSSATSDKVPVRSTGWFNPVLVFGFGAQIGLGKSIEAGILRAGFSITVFGIIEGVIARWQPHKQPTPPGTKSELQDGYFFSVTGTMGLQGRLYGSVDFAVVRADVDVSIKLFARITFAAYEDIQIQASASVSITVSLKINLGLFKITIDFSFKASIDVTFVLQNPLHGTPPWGRAVSGGLGSREIGYRQSTRRSGRAADELAERRLRRAWQAGRPRALRVAGVADQLDWNNLLAGSRLTFTGWTVPVLSVAGDEATSPAEQEICYVVNFFLPTPPPVREPAAGTAPPVLSPGASESGASGPDPAARLAHAALSRARTATDVDTNAASATFEDLAVRVVQWAIAATRQGTYTPDDLDTTIVTDVELDGLLSYLSGATTPLPVPVEAIESFLAEQTAFCFEQRATQGSADGVFFPAPPGTSLKVPDYGAWKGYDYTFGAYNSSDAGYLESLNAYFAQLRVEVDAAERPTAAALLPGAAVSIAGYVFADYFASIARQAVQALRDGLTNFKLVLDDTLQVAQIVDWINHTGELSSEPVTAAHLFVANQDHRLSVSASGPLAIVGMHYTDPGGESFDTIAAQSLFGGGVSAKDLATENASNAKILAAGQTIELAGRRHVTQTGDSLTTVAARLEVSLEELLDQSDVLASTTLLAAMAVLVVPSFGYPIVAGDTLQTVAARFGVSLDALAIANEAVAHLFDSAADPNLNVPTLSQFQIGALIDEARRTLALQNLGAMISRYHLHGLRLPTTGLQANARGLFVTGGPGSYRYPDDLGLFALTGQAFPLPSIAQPSRRPSTSSGHGLGSGHVDGGDDPVFSYTLTRGAGEGWLSLGSPGSAAITFTLDDAGDYQRYRDVATAAGGALSMGIGSIARASAAEVQPARFPLSTEVVWQAPVAVTMPREKQAPVTFELRLWPLPTALINTPLENGILPRLEPVLARTEPASGQTVDRAVDNYGFGTLVTFGVKRSTPVPGSPSSERLYEIIGAPDRDIVLLERLLRQLGDRNADFQQLQVLYRPAATGSDPHGWQMDDPAATLAGISQVNLSTDTAPPLLDAELTDEPAATPNIVNTPLELLRLLWEASITRQGGFYLGYTTGIGAGIGAGIGGGIGAGIGGGIGGGNGTGSLAGLPERAFNDRGEAELAILGIFAADEDPGQLVADYHNVAVTNQPLDLTDAALVARTIVRRSTTEPVDAAATLRSLAEDHYTTADLLAGLNADAPLASGVQIVVSGGLYEVPPTATPPGGGVQAIADHFLTTVAALQAANPHRTSWPDPLPTYTGLALPQVTVEIGRTYPNGAVFGSLADAAGYFGAPLAQLAAANLDTSGLYPNGARLEVEIGPVEQTAVLPPGVAGLDLERAVPPEVPDDPSASDWGRSYLLHMFSLLGYRMAETPDFVASNWGLAGGPADPDASAGIDKIRAPRDPAATACWLYQRTVPYPSLAKIKTPPDGLPPNTPSPYWGIGGLLQLELAWLDLFGNKILTDLDATTTAGGLLDFPPQLTGYTDRLLGVGQWPSVANAFRFEPSDQGQPLLVLSLFFDQSAYVGAPTDKIRQALGFYAQILLQLGDPAGVTLSLTTTALPGLDSVLSAAQERSVLSWVADIYGWLESLLPEASTAQRARGEAFVPRLEIAAQVDPNRLDDGQIFELSATFTIARRPELVNGDVATVAGVRAAATQLAPYTGSLESAGQQRDLGEFARGFTSAFAGLPGRTYRIAAGSTRNAFTPGDLRDVWVVQLGTAQGEAISYEIENVGDPLRFAPRPITNKLVSKPETQIISYTTGTVIQPTDPARSRSYTNVDLDQWMAAALSAVDELLTPRYVGPAQILRAKTGTDAMQRVLDAKWDLAGALQSTMIAVFADEHPTSDQTAAMQEVFRQRMLGALGAFYTVRTGIQFQASVSSAIRPQSRDSVAPRLFGDIALTGQSSITGGSLSLGSPKLELELAGRPDPGPRPLSFLLSSAGLSARNVALDLTFRGQAIEHEIEDTDGGYQASSWLSFVDAEADQSWPLTRSLGSFEAPIVLRAFPETPVLLGQESSPEPDSPCYQPADPVPARALLGRSSTAACSRPGTYNPLRDVAQWNYRLRYSIQVHHQQDTLYADVHFNIADPGRRDSLATARDLTDNLAEIVEVYPQIRDDLDRYLVPLDVDSTDPDQLRNAEAALLSAAQVFQWLADTAPAASGLDATGPDLVKAVPPVRISLREDGVLKQGPTGPVEALRVILILQAPLPDRVGLPLVEVDPATYRCELDSTTPTERRFVYQDRDSGEYLSLEKGLRIPERSVVVPDLDLLERQDADASVHLTRNENLVDDRRSADPFIYQTPVVELPSPLHPSIDVDTPVNIAAIDATGPGAPVTRPLDCQLSLLYEALFEHAGTDNVTMGLTVYYEYSLQASLPKVRLPVFMQAPTTVALSGAGTGLPLTDLVAMESQGITDWFGQHRPVTTDGTLVLDLAVMSDLTAQPMPILRLRGLYLDLADVDPPPAPDNAAAAG